PGVGSAPPIQRTTNRFAIAGCDMIDLRSDTVTQPTPEMRRMISQAVVGDDVIGFDPTVEELEAETAALLGKEAAIYMPSGSMTNQIAIRTHCRPGDEFLCEEGCHIYNYEQAAFAQLSGLVARTIVTPDGILRRSHLEGKVRPVNDHMVRTRLLCVENTHNRAAGRIQPYEVVEEVTRWARDENLATHLDGARLWNAVVATGIPARDWAGHFDSVSVCFSKGLGAPVGSALAGPRDFVREARRHRKAFGGAMRQVGIIAAGALYALRHHVDRLADDHEKAQILANAIREATGLSLLHEPIDTNIVIFTVESPAPAAAEFVQRLESRGVRALATSPHHVRLVTHMDVSLAQTQEAAEALVELAQELTAADTLAVPST
ncbi:MAG TPA: GntG family PLP-dependent aldolase, partial [Pirellulaceae bacterium]